MQKYNKYDKQYQKDQQTIKYFDSLYRKRLQDNLFDKIEDEFQCNFFKRHIDEMVSECFLKM